MSKFFVKHGERCPWWAGLVASDWARHGCWIAPIPLNLILRPLWLIYCWCQSPWRESPHERQREGRTL